MWTIVCLADAAALIYVARAFRNDSAALAVRLRCFGAYAATSALIVTAGMRHVGLLPPWLPDCSILIFVPIAFLPYLSAAVLLPAALACIYSCTRDVPSATKAAVAAAMFVFLAATATGVLLAIEVLRYIP